MTQKNQLQVSPIYRDLVIIGAGVLTVYLIIHFVFLDTGNPFYVVSSGSMVPVLNINDIIIVRNGNSFDDLKVGDVIVFHRPNFNVPGVEDRIIVHRINQIGITEDVLKRIIIQRNASNAIVPYVDPAQKAIITKGDANDRIIPGIDYPILKENYIGKVIFVIPGIGLITTYLKPPYNYVIIAGILAFLILNHKLKQSNKKTQE